MAEQFTDITGSVGSEAIFAAPRDCVLFGFEASEVLSNDPPNSIDLTFATRSLVHNRVILEYSAGPGLWKPLAFEDTTDGASADGVLHFEPPNDWAATRSWDGVSDIPGVPTALYWVRAQRRELEEDSSGAVLSAVAASSRPYAVAKRSVDSVFFDFNEGHVGSTIYFRFVPVGRDGRSYPEQDVKVSYQIRGHAFNPGNAS